MIKLQRFFISMILISLFFEPLIYAKTREPISLPTITSIPISEIVEAQEVSDRHYLPRVRDLIAIANQSLDISLFRLALTDDVTDPVRYLLSDLITAAKRGVKVRLFLNTFSGIQYSDSLFLREDQLENLRREHVEVHFTNPAYSLSDRLLIADTRWILEGGPAWTKEDLEKGLSSATLVDSPPAAQKKKLRLELLPLWDIQIQKEERTSGVISIPLTLLTELKYFPTMTQYEDADAFKIYLALLKIFTHVRNAKFDIVFEDLAQELPIDRAADKNGVVFQVQQALERLQEKYNLLKIEKSEPASASIALTLAQKNIPAVGIPIAFFEGNYAKELSVQGLYAYFVILYRSQMSGNSPVWLGSPRNVENDFPISHDRFQVGADELRRSNIIEIFPFRLNPGNRIPEVRYLLNPLPSLSERLDTWSRLRNQFGDDVFEKAHRAAEVFGEPEDPKVVAVFIGFLNRYPEEAVESLAEHVSKVHSENTAALLDYLETLLKYESRPEYQVGTHVQ